MSYIPPKQLDKENLIVQYVVSSRGKGHFLPYDEYYIIKKWLQAADSAESLLLVLSEILPDFYQKSGSKRLPPSLSRLDKKISAILDVKRQRARELEVDRKRTAVPDLADT